MLGANDLNCVDVPLNPTQSLYHKWSVFVQVYLQNSKLEDGSDTDVNRQLDRLVDLSNFYAEHWSELPNVPPNNIVPGTECLITSTNHVICLSVCLAARLCNRNKTALGCKVAVRL